MTVTMRLTGDRCSIWFIVTPASDARDAWYESAGGHTLFGGSVKEKTGKGGLS